MSGNMWGLHMANIQAAAPVDGNFVGIGWDEMGDLSTLTQTREAFKRRYAEVYSSEKPVPLRIKAGVLYRFALEIDVGDIIVSLLNLIDSFILALWKVATRTGRKLSSSIRTGVR